MSVPLRYDGRTVHLLALGLLLISLWPLAAATPPKAAPQAKPAPEKEQLRYQRAPFSIERSMNVTAKDVGLPFLAGAQVTSGYLYRLTDDKEKLLSFYATVQLTTPGTPQKVAQEYSRQIPGHPKPQQLKDKQGERWVLAIGSDKETRTVTVRAAKSGSTIELTRVTKPVTPTQPPDTEEPAQPQTPRSPRGPRGPHAPRTPGGAYNA